MELREIVMTLKKKLESRDNDILYYRSLDHDSDVRVDSLREEVHELRRENYKLKMENKEFQRFVFDGERREKRNMY